MYILKQGVYQIKLLEGAKPIEYVLRNPAIEPLKRQKLELIIRVVKFGEKKLGLLKNKNYKNVNLDFEHVIYNVSGTKQLAFEAYYWHFPIIGNVPYKGFFALEDAITEQKQLEALGFETLTYQVGGYSTLGYFPDPVWPSMLELSQYQLIELILHELTHLIIYFKNQSNFNESLANFVGQELAREFIVKNYGISSKEVLAFDNYKIDLDKNQDFFHRLYKELDELYKSNISEQEKLQQKIILLNNAKEDYKNLEIKSLKSPNWSKVNNAYLMSYKRYNTDTNGFKKLFFILNGNMLRFIKTISTLDGESEPFVALSKLIKKFGKGL